MNNNLNENNYNDITSYNPFSIFLQPITIGIPNIVNTILNENQQQNIFNNLFQLENEEIKKDFFRRW